MVHSSRLQKNKIGNPLPFFFPYQISLTIVFFFCCLYSLSCFESLELSLSILYYFHIPFFSNMKIKVVRCRKGRNEEATKDQRDIGGW